MVLSTALISNMFYYSNYFRNIFCSVREGVQVEPQTHLYLMY